MKKFWILFSVVCAVLAIPYKISVVKDNIEIAALAYNIKVTKDESAKYRGENQRKLNIRFNFFKEKEKSEPVYIKEDTIHDDEE